MMKLPKIENGVPMPKADGRGNYERPRTGLVKMLIGLKRGQSFVCDPALYKRVRQLVMLHKIRIIVRKINDEKMRVWKFER